MFAALTSSKSSSFLDNLLPYDASQRKNGDLRTGLKEYQFLMEALLEAIAAFKNGELEKFDALVGENACQIRAIRTALIAARDLIDFDALKIKSALVQEKIVELLSPKKISTAMHSNISLKELIDQSELTIPLTTEEIFLIQTYLLSEAKEIKPSLLCRKEVADPKKIKRFGDVTSGFAKSLVRKLRKLLATTSVEFVRDCALILQDKHLMKMTSEDFTVKHNTCWPCIPMFWAYQVLLLTAQREGIPLIIHVKFKAQDRDHEVICEDYLFYSVDEKGSSYLESIPSAEYLGVPACVIQGVVYADRDKLPSKAEWKSAIDAHSIVDIILAGAADHRQYPDSSHDVKVEALNDKAFNRSKALAKSKGFALENPTTFFIQHVYASKAGNIPELAAKAIIARMIRRKSSISKAPLRP